MAKTGYSFGALADSHDALSASHDTEKASLAAEIARADSQAQAIGNIMNPIFHLPLINNLGIKSGAGDVTFTRDTAATYIDRYGVVQSAAVDEPRFEKRGLLMEGPSANIALNSEDPSASGWLPSGLSAVTPNDTAAPDGATTGCQILESTGTSAHGIFAQVNVVSGTAYTFSVFVKQSGRTGVQLRLGSTGFNPTPIVTFDLSDGTVHSNVVATIYSIEALANDWYRVSITSTATATAAVNCVIYTYDIDGDILTYTGDATKGLYIWGAQVEASQVQTSYIPTTSTAVSRGGDICFADSTNFPRYDKNFSVVADISLHGDAAGTQRAWMLGGVVNVILQDISAGMDYAFYSGTGAYISTGSIADYDTKDTHRVACVADVDNAMSHIYSDGALANSNTWAVATGTPTAIGIGGNIAGAQFMNGHIRNLRIYDIALTAEEARLA